MLMAGRFRWMSVWLWSSPPPGARMLVIVRPDRPALVERMRRVFAREPGEVAVMLDRRRRDRRCMVTARDVPSAGARIGDSGGAADGVGTRPW